MISFTVFGIPQTKGSTKAFYRPGMRYPVITNDNPRNKSWAQTVSAMAQQARTAECPYTGPIVLQLVFDLPIPQSLPKRRISFATKRPDIDKCARSLCDALKGVLYADDSQVVGLHVVKRYGREPGVLVTVDEVHDRHEELARYCYQPDGVPLFLPEKEVAS